MTATGHFPRRRIQSGYLRCKVCKRDLPEEEFQRLRRVYAGKERFYRQSYCKKCMSNYNGEREAHRRQTDEEWRAKKNRATMQRYHRGLGAEKKRDLKERRRRGQELVSRLVAAHFSPERISTMTGINTKALRSWLRGEGRPSDNHIERLTVLINGLVAALTGQGGDPL